MMRLDLRHNRLIDGDKVCQLTPHQAIIMSLLSTGRLIKYETIANRLWPARLPDYAYVCIRVHIFKIRKNAKDANIPLNIITSWGTGFRLAEPIPVSTQLAFSP